MLKFSSDEVKMSCFLKIGADGSVDQKSSNFGLIDPSVVSCSKKNSVYALSFRGLKVLGIAVQPEKFDELVVSQVGYENDGAIVRLVTMNRQPKEVSWSATVNFGNIPIVAPTPAVAVTPEVIKVRV